MHRVGHPHHARGMGGSGQANLNTTYQRLKKDHSVHLPFLQLQVTHFVQALQTMRTYSVDIE